MSADADLDPEDCATCEGCSRKHSWETTRSTDDGCYECPECQAAADEAFRTCDHEWSAHHNSHGEPGQFCGRCLHIVNDEDFPLLFPGVPLSTEAAP